MAPELLKPRVWAGLAVLALACLGADVARAEPPAPAPPGEEATAPAAPTASAPPPVIVDVRIDADVGIPTEQIRRSLPVRMAAPFDATAEAAVRRFLASLPIIGHSELHVEPSPAGDVLVLDLTRQPVVREIEFAGIFPVFERDALKALRMRAGDAFDPSLLPAEAERVAKLMEQNGFQGSTCSAESADDGGEISIRYPCSRGSLTRVGAITVTGSSALSDDEVGSALRPWIFFTRDDLTKRVEKLEARYRELGYVRVHVDAVPGPADADGHVPLAVTVRQGKKLSVELSGNESIDEDDLREVLPFAREGGYGIFLVEEGAEAIRALYESKGFPSVEVAKERVEHDDDVRVRYTIREGAERSLAAVCIDDPAIGAEEDANPEDCRRFVRKRAEPPPVAAPADASRVAPAAPVALKPQDALGSGRSRWLLLAPRWQSALLEEDRGALIDYYKSVGFAEATVGIARMESVDEGVVAVFPVDRGPLYRIGTVSIEGSRADIADLVAAKLTAATGDLYRTVDVDAVAAALEKELQSVGYLAARVEASVELVPTPIAGGGEPTEGAAEVAFRIAPGPLYRVTDLVLLGANETRKGVVKRAFALEPGALLTPGGLADTQKNVRDLEVFDAIQVAPVGLDVSAHADAVVEPIDVPVKVQVRERPRTELDLGFGYDTDRGASGRFTFRQLNLFDRAKKLTVNGTYGQRDKGSTVVLSDPRLFGSSFKGALSGAYSDTDLEAFDQRSIRVGGSVSRALPWDLTAAFEVGYELTDTSNVVADDPDAPEPGTSRELLLTPSLAYDSRDDLLYPTRGTFASVSIGLSSRAYLSDDNFVRYDLQARRYQTLADGIVAVASVRFTDVDLYGSTTVVPTPELLFTGGTSTVRGFEEDRIGPLDSNGKPLGGGARLLGNLELRFPLVWLLEGALFVDAGEITRTIAAATIDKFQVGAGAGIRLRSPVGPLRLDVGYPVVAGAAPDGVGFHFSFGYPF
ncbi:MAG: BamA/TamA family outer membrane protein [bacterium]